MSLLKNVHFLSKASQNHFSDINSHKFIRKIVFKFIPSWRKSHWDTGSNIGALTVRLRFVPNRTRNWVFYASYFTRKVLWTDSGVISLKNAQRLLLAAFTFWLDYSASVSHKASSSLQFLNWTEPLIVSHWEIEFHLLSPWLSAIWNSSSADYLLQSARTLNAELPSRLIWAPARVHCLRFLAEVLPKTLGRISCAP